MTLLGIDIGGTFTDVVVIADGRATFGKVLTTPHDPTEALLVGALDTLARAGVDPSSVTRVAHATTLATNVVLEGRGVRVAFVTTAGFRWLVPLGRASRGGDERFDLHFDAAAPPVPVERCFEVVERIDASGEVVTPLDEASVEAIELADVEAVAVCLLHSWANDVHERRVGALLRERLGDVPVVLSCDVWPELREFDRAATTIMSAYVGPVMARYLADLRRRLTAAGIDAPVHVMDSSGGVMSAELASARAVRTIESGPAAGVVAAAGLGLPDVLSFDMGGTTAKAAVVRDGRPERTYDFRVGGTASGGSGGLLLKVPAIDLVEVGSGGGSIAWVDAAGALHVGPQSAGADPGPACYGRGGVQATVTDADLLLGYLPDIARVELDGPAAEAALRFDVADPLGVSLIDAAWAVHELANATMGDAVHMVTVQRGIDPRRFALVALGGAGPVHAARVADRFGIDRVIVPVGTGVASAIGLLTSDVTTERSHAFLAGVDVLDLAALAAMFERLATECRADLGGDGEVERALDMRYRGQAHDLTVVAPGGDVDKRWLDATVEAFHARYAERYGNALTGPVEVVAARVRLRQPNVVALAGHRPAKATENGKGRAWFGSGWVETAVLRERAAVDGPAIVVEPEATVVVPPGWRAEPDETGNLVLWTS